MQWKGSDSSNFQQPPAGTHLAVCIKIIDIGTQEGEYQGRVTKRRQVIIGWELPTEIMAEGASAGKPFVISKFYTASLHEKSNLRVDLKNWRGRDFTAQELAGFNAQNILGKACLLSLTENDQGKVRVTGVMAPGRGIRVPPQHNPSVFFSLDPEEFDAKIFEMLSDGIKKLIMASPEYHEAINPKGGHDNDWIVDDIELSEDKIPF